MASKKYEEKYTKPKMREKLKEKIKKSNKGGEKGQWSARKSQLLVQEYEKKGGDYKKDTKDKAAKSLAKWSDENWQTKGGKAKARDKGSTHRYLPEKVWDKLSKKEQQQAERKKEKASEKGEQYVEWTAAIRREMEKLGYSKQGKEESTKEELYNKAKELDIKGRSKMKKKELKNAVGKAQKKGQTQQQVSKKDLEKQARKLGIDNASDMKKNKLAKAVRKEDQKQLQDKKKGKLVKMADKLGINKAQGMKKKKLAKQIAKVHSGEKAA